MSAVRGGNCPGTHGACRSPRTAACTGRRRRDDVEEVAMPAGRRRLSLHVRTWLTSAPGMLAAGIFRADLGAAAALIPARAEMT